MTKKQDKRRSHPTANAGGLSRFCRKIYKGPLVNGLKEGKGWLKIQHIIFEGTFAADVLEGAGTLKLLDDGIIYSGTFVHGKLQGPGRVTYPNGDVYEAEFKDNTLKKRGELIYISLKV